MTSRTQMEGKEILTRLHSHNPTAGSYVVEISAGVGKGKTAMLLSFAKYNMENHSGEKNFFCECFDTPLQSLKLGKENVQFWMRAIDYNYVEQKDNVKVHKGPKLCFRDRDHKLKEVTAEEMNVKWFYTFDELFEKADTNKLNVPLIHPRYSIFNLIQIAKSKGVFSNFYCDEFSELAPFGMPFKRSMKIAALLKDLRKCFVNVYYTVQTKTQIDWRTRGIISVKIFGPGAQCDKHCRLVQRAIDNLKVDPINGNEYWIIEGGQFGLFRLKDIFEPQPGGNIECHVIKTEKEKIIDDEE